MKATRKALEEFYLAYVDTGKAKAGEPYKTARARLVAAFKRVREENE